LLLHLLFKTLSAKLQTKTKTITSSWLSVHLYCPVNRNRSLAQTADLSRKFPSAAAYLTAETSVYDCIQTGGICAENGSTLLASPSTSSDEAPPETAMRGKRCRRHRGVGEGLKDLGVNPVIISYSLGLFLIKSTNIQPLTATHSCSAALGARLYILGRRSG
jgi:hypothetical protein